MMEIKAKKVLDAAGSLSTEVEGDATKISSNNNYYNSFHSTNFSQGSRRASRQKLSASKPAASIDVKDHLPDPYQMKGAVAKPTSQLQRRTLSWTGAPNES